MAFLLNCLYVGIGGFLGSVLRYLFSFLPLGGESSFPYTTLIVNVTGALLIGFIVAYLARFFAPDHELLLFLRVGVCGGFTTFSAFSFESMELLKSGEILTASVYIVVSVVLCLGAVVLGDYLAGWTKTSA
ncbi:MAG: fluoride efflux transporter CrcB [Raoultibacter sp.]|jgi:CrcB protein